MSKQPSKSLRASVSKAFDATMLKDICVRQDFSEYAKFVPLAPDKYNRDRFYWYQDNGSKILAVAHLDTVQASRECEVTSTAGGLLATSGALDDRLGAYVILEMLPALGIECDILLTTDEEMGASTAIEFDTEKQYNWIIQFDRGGTDVVMYQYDTPELRALVGNAGAQVGHGSYSDIAVLDHLGCSAFNWGVGYQDYHSARAHAFLDDTFRMVARFCKFYRANAETFLPYDYSTEVVYAKELGKWDSWKDIDDDEFLDVQMSDDDDTSDWRALNQRYYDSLEDFHEEP
jgi:hypothetical protein